MLQVGPLVLPYALLLAFAVALTSVSVGRRLGRAADIDAQIVVWKALLVGVVIARLAFVYEFRSVYLAAPLDIVDVRDGGWTPWVGAVGAWLYVFRHTSRRASLKVPLRAALGAGTVVLIAGSVALALLPKPGLKLPSFSMTTLEGETAKLDEFAGKPTVVNLWATWCPPCIREMPVLHQAQLSQPAVNFVFVNQGEPSKRVEDWLRARQLALTNVLLDRDGRTAAAFNKKALPTTLFFNANGELVNARIGELSEATLRQELEKVSP
ncbi:MAG TPA: TlpA disulfide reductase family protein [Rubrivivax sp.]|nr:TlpA disulfide reductase family protein [Rubrivivax sp.]